MVDYLQPIQGSRSDNRVQEISYITRSLKELARELNVPVIRRLAAVPRAGAAPAHIPMLSDLRESGSIEQDADVVLFIYREDRYMTPRGVGGAEPRRSASAISGRESAANHRQAPQRPHGHGRGAFPRQTLEVRRPNDPAEDGSYQ